MTYTFDDSLISDLHKDAYGYRPSSAYWLNWQTLSADDKQAEWEYLCSEVERSETLRFQAEVAAQVRWEKHIDQLMAINDIDRATAIRWDMDAEDAGSDYGYYCFKVGLSYDREIEIKKLVEG